MVGEARGLLVGWSVGNLGLACGAQGAAAGGAVLLAVVWAC